MKPAIRSGHLMRAAPLAIGSTEHPPTPDYDQRNRRLGATLGDVLLADRGHLLSRLRSFSENRHRGRHTSRILTDEPRWSAVAAMGLACGRAIVNQQRMTTMPPT